MYVAYTRVVVAQAGLLQVPLQASWVYLAQHIEVPKVAPKGPGLNTKEVSPTLGSLVAPNPCLCVQHVCVCACMCGVLGFGCTRALCRSSTLCLITRRTRYINELLYIYCVLCFTTYTYT